MSSGAVWERKVASVEPITDLAGIPNYGALFFFRNMGPFRRIFFLLTICRICSCLLKFGTVFLLSRVISGITTLSVNQVFGFYLPAWLAAQISAEFLDYFTRKYAEALPIVYAEQLTLRFYLAFLQLNFHRLSNFSKERLGYLIGKYVANVQAFLADWVWGSVGNITRFIIVLVILGVQSPLVLLVNLGYMLVFLALALRISARFSVVARNYSEQLLESATVTSSFALNLNTVRRLGITRFFKRTYQALLGRNWQRLEAVREFHARRWLLQLSLFDLLYIGTLVAAVYQVKIGTLQLGFLVLIKWAFDELWQILVYIIEYYVSLVQQKQDALMIRREFETLAARATGNGRPPVASPWKRLELRSVVADFSPPDQPARKIHISIPELELRAGDKLGVIGPSGAGKTTILNILLNMIEYQGSYTADGRDVRGVEVAADAAALISSQEPLFKVSLRDNILLGREVPAARLEEILRGVRVSEFRPDLDKRVGDATFHLSAGQEQRIRLARGLLQESQCYLLDEPFSGIDRDNKRMIIEFLREFLKDRTLVLVTHNPEELELIERVYELRDGVLLDQGRSSER